MSNHKELNLENYSQYELAFIGGFILAAEIYGCQCMRQVHTPEERAVSYVMLMRQLGKGEKASDETRVQRPN